MSLTGSQIPKAGFLVTMLNYIGLRLVTESTDGHRCSVPLSYYVNLENLRKLGLASLPPLLVSFEELGNLVNRTKQASVSTF